MELHVFRLLLTLSLICYPLIAAQPVTVPLHLSRTYYAATCPRLESLVFNYVRVAVRREPRLGAKLLRLIFHDCFVKGCDASILMDGLDENPAEKNANPNQSVGGCEFMDALKAAVETECPATVSCADLIAMAARDSVHLLGGPRAQLRFGRLDGKSTSSGSVVGKLPDPFSSISTVLTVFSEVGLDATDTVALSGAHTIGKAQCKHTLNSTNDDTMTSALRIMLSKQCGTIPNFMGLNLIPNDPVTPVRFDNQYYKNLLAKSGMFTSDQSMTSDPQTLPLVQLYAANQSAFFRQFALSLAKMSEIGVLSEPEGEVRTNCRLPRALSGSVRR